MRSAVAWNVKGVGPEARETARASARRAGMSVGEWLNTVINDSADGDAAREEEERGEAEGFSAIHKHLDMLASRLGQIRAAGSTRPQDRRGDLESNLQGLETWLSGIAKDLARCGEEAPQ